MKHHINQIALFIKGVARYLNSISPLHRTGKYKPNSVLKVRS